MITANQLRAARALLNIDQRQMAELADLSVPTIQRMEASDGVVRGNVDSLMKLVAALDGAGIELINPVSPARPVAVASGSASMSPSRRRRQRRSQSRLPRGRWNGRAERAQHRNDLQDVAVAASTVRAAPAGPAAWPSGRRTARNMQSTGITSETPPTTA